VTPNRNFESLVDMVFRSPVCRDILRNIGRALLALMKFVNQFAS
jgi:hypothetical protein